MTSGKRLFAKVAPFAKLIRGIAHPHRLAILYLLAHDPLWMKELKIHLGIPENLLAHHLKEMLKAGWVVRSKEGRHTTYGLNEKALRELPKLLEDTPLGRRLFPPKS